MLVVEIFDEKQKQIFGTHWTGTSPQTQKTRLRYIPTSAE